MSVDGLVDKFKNSVSSGMSVMEKDEGMGRPITKKQFLNFIDNLSEGLTMIRKEIEGVKDEIMRLQNKK
jgi:hypothetical protein